MSSATATTSADRGDQVVSLADYRNARQAAAFLRGTLHEPGWLRDVVVEVADDGGARIVILLAWHTELLARCLPTSVNHVPVLLRVVG